MPQPHPEHMLNICRGQCEFNGRGGRGGGDKLGTSLLFCVLWMHSLLRLSPNSLAALKVLSNGSRMRSWHHKSPYQFRPVPVPVPWYRTVAVFLVCHNMYNVDAPRVPSTHTANSAGRRSTAHARSRPGKQNTLVSFPDLESD